jgi:phosphatidylglycerophosphate synthase
LSDPKKFKSGTRYVLANLLTISGLPAGDVGRIISHVVSRPGYPSPESISDSLRTFAIDSNSTKCDSAALQKIIFPVFAFLNSSPGEYVLLVTVHRKGIVVLCGSGMLEEIGLDSERWNVGVTAINISFENYRGVTQTNFLSVTGFEGPRRENLGIGVIRKLRLKNEPVVYQAARLVSPYLSFLFIKFHFRPNYITASWILPIIGAGFVLSRPTNAWCRVLVVGLVIFGYILDCCDGEVARYTKQFSSLGGYLDLINHFLSGPILILGLSIGTILVGHEHMAIFFLWSLFGSLVLNAIGLYMIALGKRSSAYEPASGPFGFIYWLFPLDCNLIVLSIAFGKAEVFCKIWPFFSLGYALTILCPFLLKEYRDQESKKR